MGEWVYATVDCRPEDRKVFEGLGYQLDMEHPAVGKAPGRLHMVTEQASYGNCDEMSKLFHDGIPFLASHEAAPGQFPACAQVSDGEDYYDVEVNAATEPIVRVLPDGSVDKGSLALARKYLRVYRRVCRRLGIRRRS